MGVFGRRREAGRLVRPAGLRTSAGRLDTAGGEVGSPLYYAKQYGLVLWLRADMGVTLGGTLRATGTSPPAWTISGTPAVQVQPHFEIDSVAGGTGLGQATYKWSMDGGATYTATGVVTAAGPTALGATGLSVAMAAGPYNIDNKYDGTVSAWADQSGNANHAAQATASRQPIFEVAGLNNKPAINPRGAAAVRLEVPSLSLGAFTIMTVCASNSASRYLYVHNTDAGTNGSYMFTSLIGAYRSSSRSEKNVTSTWLNATPASYCQVCDGSNAGHVPYRNGVAGTTTPSGGFAADPGTGVVTATLYIGSSQAGTFVFNGPISEVVAFSGAMPPAAVLTSYNGQMTRWGV